MSLGVLGSGGVGPKRMLRFFGENCVGGESDWENRSDSNKSLVWSLLGRGPILFGVGLEAFLDQAVRNKNAYFFSFIIHDYIHSRVFSQEISWRES